MRFLTSSLAVALFALAVPLAAAETISLDEAVRLALEQNPSQAAAREAVAAAAAAVEKARADRRPAVDLVAGAREFETHAFLPSGLTPPNGTTTIGPTEDWSLAVEGRWLFYDSGRGNARVDVAKASHAASEHEFSTARADLVLAVHNAYRTYQAALAAREAAKSRVDRTAARGRRRSCESALRGGALKDPPQPSEHVGPAVFRALPGLLLLKIGLLEEEAGTAPLHLQAER